MAKAKIPNLNERFSRAAVINNQEQEIQRLTEQLEQLRSENKDNREETLAKFRDELKNYSGEKKIAIARMRPSKQARQTFSKSAIYKRAESLKRLGQLNPIILVPSKDKPDYFDIEDGELRWRAANLIVENEALETWKCLRAVIVPPPVDERELHKRSLIHHLHQEDLNALDRIEAIISQIYQEVEIEISFEEIEAAQSNRFIAGKTKIKKIIRNLDYLLKNNPTIKNKVENLLLANVNEQRETLEQLDFSTVQVKVLLILLELQQNICSLAANDLPMLSLPDDLKEAIRLKELPCPHARAISKISSTKFALSEERAVKLRLEAVTFVVENNLSLKNTRNFIDRLLQENNLGSKIKSRKFKVKELNKAIEKVKISELSSKDRKELRSTLIAKLNELEVYSQQNLN